MDNRTLQTSIIKNDLEFVGRATEIITKLVQQVDKCCPNCKELLKESLQIEK